jgi:hypothetical protein
MKHVDSYEMAEVFEEIFYADIKPIEIFVGNS